MRRRSPTFAAPSAKGDCKLHEDRGQRPRRATPIPRARRARPTAPARKDAALPGRRTAATSTCTTSATATGSPPSRPSASSRFRRVYDLRHTFATFALRAGISTFELSRYMGASLTMIDRHYGHLARDGREHAIRLLDDLQRRRGGRRWTLGGRRTAGHARTDNRNAAEQEKARSPLTDSNRRPPPYHGGFGLQQRGRNSAC